MASISANTLLEYSYKDTNDDIQTGSDSFTSSATGKDFDEAFTNLNKVIDNEVNINLLRLQSTLSPSTLITNVNSNYINEPYNISGSYINLTNLEQLFINKDSYGANSTVDYLVPIYKENTTIQNNIPVYTMTYNSFLLCEFTLDETFFQNHNLFIFTPYIYSYKNMVIFGTIDQNLFFTKQSLSSDNKIKICFTCSKTIADTYSKQNYFISKFPSEYIDGAFFNILIRLGTINGKGNSAININSYSTTSYNILNNIDETNLYTSKEIISAFPLVYKPYIDNAIEKLINDYNLIADYLSRLSSMRKYTLYPYFSQQAGTNYAIQSFYDSINLSTPIEIYGNNTGENYNMTDVIINNDKEKYLYILAPNQNTFNASVTSNIQIYNKDTKNAIQNGSIITAPNLSLMSYTNYPYSYSNLFPVYQLYKYNFSSINPSAENITIVVTERLSYSIINYNHVDYDSVNKSVVFTGDNLTNEQVSFLNNTFNINVVELESS